MADTNRNSWDERSRNRNNQFDRSRDDYSTNYGYNRQPGYRGEDYMSDEPRRRDYDDTYSRVNERRDDYSTLDPNRNPSTNMGSGYDPYDYGQTIGSFNQGKEGSYSSRFDYDRYRGSRGYDERDSGYDSDYNRSYGRYGNTNYGAGSHYGQSFDNRYDKRHYQGNSDWERDRSGYSNRRNDRDWWDRATDEVASWFGDDEAERRRERDKRMGPHKGKGPKGYHRGDERIKDDISDRLSDDPFIDASDVEVTCENADVVLTGTVETREEKRRAEDIAERVSGVKNVENRLRVKNRAHSSGDTIYRDRD